MPSTSLSIPGTTCTARDRIDLGSRLFLDTTELRGRFQHGEDTTEVLRTPHERAEIPENLRQTCSRGCESREVLRPLD
jgi:hypothetical protein